MMDKGMTVMMILDVTERRFERGRKYDCSLCSIDEVRK